MFGASERKSGKEIITEDLGGEPRASKRKRVRD
jgi:hypothetical protein